MSAMAFGPAVLLTAHAVSIKESILVRSPEKRPQAVEKR